MRGYYNIADLKVIIDNPSEIAKNRLLGYRTPEFDNADIVLKQSIAKIPDKYNTEELALSYEYMREGRNFYMSLLKYDGFMLHASAVVYEGQAFLFSASSGIGKSTHTQLWLDRFGPEAFILNDDKPAIRVIDKDIYAYGTPWSGKNDISVNAGYKIKGICFIERAESNEIEKMDIFTAAARLYYSTIRSLHKEDIPKLLNLINYVADKIPIYKLGCNISIDAVELSYKTMTSEIRSSNNEKKR